MAPAPPEFAARRGQPNAQAQGQSKFGELLLRTGKIDQQQLVEALAMQKEQGGRLGTTLVKMGVLNERQLVGALSIPFHVPQIDLGAMEIDESVIKIIPADIARN